MAIAVSGVSVSSVAISCFNVKESEKPYVCVIRGSGCPVAIAGGCFLGGAGI